MDLGKLGITKEDVLNMAADKLLKNMNIEEEAFEMLTRRVNDTFSGFGKTIDKALQKMADERLSKELDNVLERIITPMNTWGDATGEKPMKLKDIILKKAEEYWLTPVDKNGKATSAGYSSAGRADYVMQRHLKEAFESAMKENVTEIVAAFKKALHQDLYASCSRNIEALIKGQQIKIVPNK